MATCIAKRSMMPSKWKQRWSNNAGISFYAFCAQKPTAFIYQMLSACILNISSNAEIWDRLDEKSCDMDSTGFY